MAHTIHTLPDGTRYAVIPEWTSRAHACPVQLPADVVAIDAETWGTANAEPERAVRYARMIAHIGQRHRRQRGIPQSRSERERQAEREWQRGRQRGRPS